MLNSNPENSKILLRMERKLDQIEKKLSTIEPEKLDIAQLAIDLRRERRAFFPDHYFGDHGWDILLELYLANRSGQKTQLALIGNNTNIPKNIALRYLDLFMQDGLVYQENNRFDNDRSYIILTPKAHNLLQDIFSSFQDNVAERSRGINATKIVESTQRFRATNTN